MMFGTDPVAVDAVCHDYIVKQRMQRGIQKLESKKQSDILFVAEALGLGVADRAKIRVKEIKA
jgi:uncharacterized Fe-S center protein